MPSLDLGPVVGPQGEQGATGAQGIRGEQGLPGPNQVTNSTATPLTGVLTGNGSVVGVASIDAAPTADSTGFAQSGGTYNAIKGRVPVYGMGKNLLRNPCFVGGGTGSGTLPVNQRGLSSYTSEGYSIDNWKKKSANQISGSAVLTADGITLTGESGSWCMLRQEIENYAVLLGKEVTISAYTSEGLLKKTGTLPSVLSSSYSLDLNFTVGILQLTMIVGTEYYFAIRASGTTAVTVYAVKLELGSEQTLCHNEGTAEAPVWVLNEIPDYEYELFRCMTSTADSSDTYANKTIATGQELAYVENGTTASRAYAAGEFFCWNGLLYQVITAIPSGANFTIGTNCEAVPGGGFNQLSSISIKVFSNWRYNANLGNYLDPGVFWIASGAINGPTTNPWCPLLVLPRGTSSPDTAMQVMFLDGYISTRRFAGGTWTEWKTVALANN